MTPQQAATLAAAIKAAYPRHSIDEAALALWATELSEFEYGPAELAVRQLIRTSRFPPSIAEVATAIAERELGLPTATIAWAQVQTEEGRRSCHPLVREALQLVGGSWGLKTTENLNVLRRDFLRFYDELRQGALLQRIQARSLAPGQSAELVHVPALGTGAGHEEH